MNENPNSKPLVPDSGKLVFLVGMPGAGKTYWGEQVAHKLGFAFVDLDAAIVSAESASISALFATYGEGGFREREQTQLKRLIKDTRYNTIIACGGGTPCYANNMQLIKNAGIVIYLQSDIQLLLAHLSQNKEVRPLLNNRGDLGIYLSGLLKKREPFYGQAHHILQTKDISVATFAKIIPHV